MAIKRIRDLGVTIGRFQTGAWNAITDVPGVLVGHKTVIRDQPTIVRTGVTVILPRDGKVYQDFPMAGFETFNGVGEMTGLPLLEEWGLLTSPIVLTNTNQVGMAWNAISRYGAHQYGGFAYKLPVVAETYDGELNDIDSYPLTEDDVIAALNSATSGPVQEGNVGGGTGMTSYEFKGGIGTSSRLVETGGAVYTIGALVQANHGLRHQLTIAGLPVGQWIDKSHVPEPTAPQDSKKSSSILVIIATDAPLIPGQCKRLARRATIGLARTGGVGYNTSGDLFLAFATGNHYLTREDRPIDLKMLPQGMMNPFIEATADAVEESILNALTTAETITGYKGRTAYELPLDELAQFIDLHRKRG